MDKTIIILGTGDTMRFTDFKADEVYGVNGAYTVPNAMPIRLRHYFKMDKLFIADTLFSHEQGSLNFDINAINKFAEKYNCTIYSLNKMVLGKYKMNCKKLPADKLIEYFGSGYFTDTVCYMIAYALYENSYLAQSPEGVIRPELSCHLTIRLAGIDMCTTREYAQSKGGVEHWLGIARGMGCEIDNGRSPTILVNSFGVSYGYWHKLRFPKKQYDIMGIMDGKEPTEEDYDKMAEKLRMEENEKGNKDTGKEWKLDDKPGEPVHNN